MSTEIEVLRRINQQPYAYIIHETSNFICGDVRKKKEFSVILAIIYLFNFKFFCE